MSKLNGREVRTARLHGPLNMPNMGSNGSTLDFKAPGSKLSGSITDLGIHVTGKNPHGINVEFLIPFAMCTAIDLVPEAKA